MSTRSNLIIEDDYNRIQLYRHADGYPNGQYGVLAEPEEAISCAWSFPRFEASDFAAAIVRAWKSGAGNVYIDGSPTAWELIHDDTEWVYVIKAGDTEPLVEVYDWHKYWFGKADPNEYEPVPVMQMKLSEAERIGMEWE